MVGPVTGANRRAFLARAAEGGATEELERVSIGRLINTYLREVGGAVTGGGDLPSAVREEVRRHGCPFCLELAGGGGRLVTALARASAGGHHAFAGPVFAVIEGRSPWPCTAREVAGLLLAEIAAREADGAFGERRRRQVQREIEVSLENTAAFATAAVARGRTWLGLEGTSAFIAAEQSLVFGHPFHPSPKSGDRLETAGGSCRPELGAAFRLHYLAVEPSLLLEDRQAAGPALVFPEVAEEGRQRLPRAARDWPLLPIHPWQAELLLARPAVAALVARDRLLPLGELGAAVFPTSSVRTVYVPEHDRFLKLALDARITNFVRNNPVEHLERSLAASRVLAAVVPGRRLGIVPEIGYRGVSPGAWEGPEGADHAASLAVLFRGGIQPASEHTLVPVAALLEPALPGGAAPLAEVLARAARSQGRPLTAALACDWAKAYCEATLVPLLDLFIRHGISLEAHVQNTLVALQDGWPQRALVRDLEGTSISRRRALAGGLWGGAIRASSPVLVDEGEAWQRLLYYVVVNHLAHVLATMAGQGPAEEWQLWQVARAVIQDAPDLQGAPASAHVRELLERAELPAKANLVSRFRDHSEKPRYVSIANPLAAREPGR